MTESFVMSLGRDALLTTLLVGAPMLGVSLVVGLIISLFQAMTQINESTLTFVPKVIAFGVVLMVAGPWMLEKLIYFTVKMLEMLPQMVK